MTKTKPAVLPVPGWIPPKALDRCQACKAPFIWAKTDRGKWLCVDAHPQPPGAGNVKLTEGGPSGVTATVKSAHLAFGLKGLHKAHWATCPHPARFRQQVGRRG